MTEAIAIREQVISNAENAVAGTPPRSCGEGCQPCRRVDLQLLVVTPSVVPKEHENALKRAGYQFAPSFDAEFGSHAREATVPVARIAGAGYFMVFYPATKRWDVWQVMSNGLTRKVMHQVNAQQYAGMQAGFVHAPPPKSCSRGAANLPASLISISGAIDVDEVWIAYTPHLWLATVLQRFADNAVVTVPSQRPGAPAVSKPLRDLHGRTLSPSGVLNGAGFPAGALPFNAAGLGAVADFAKEPGKDFLNAFELAIRPLDKERFGQAEAFEKTVRTIEKASGPPANRELYVNKSLILMVDDAIGVVEQHNTLRLAAKEAKDLWIAGGPGIQQATDPTRPWALRSSLHLDMVLQWEAAAEAHRITQSTDNTMHRRYGAVVTKEAFEARQAQGGYPAGTTWEPLYVMERGQPKLDANGQKIVQTAPSQIYAGGLTVKGRVRLPADAVQRQANANGADTAQGMRGRLEGRVDMQQVSFFRSEFKAESDRWDKRIGQLDRDFLAWRHGWRFGSTYLNYFEHRIDLITPDAKLGTPDQQVADFITRLEAIDKAMGGGAITIDSAKALAAMHKLETSKPENWLSHSMHQGFSFKKNVWEDAGNNTEAGESGVASRELHRTIRSALGKQRERLQLENTLNSVLAVRNQMVNLVAAAVENKTAEALGIAAVAAEEARQAARVHVKFGLLAEELVHTRPATAARRSYVFNMKVPTGVALDEMSDAMRRGVMPIKHQPRNETRRAERRHTREQFRKLEGRINSEMNFPVLLDRSMLEELRAQARTSGEKLVEIVPDAQLGLSSGPIKVPEHLARRLIREQSVGFKEVMLKTGEGKVLTGIFGLQMWALQDAAFKIGKKQGVEQADALLSTVSTVLSGAETFATGVLHMYELRADGARTLRLGDAARLAKLRLAAGVFGAVSSAVDGTLAFVRASHSGRAGDASAANAYTTAGVFYFLSTASSAFGAIAGYQAFVGTSFIGTAMSVPATALLGAWLMGAGIVLAVVGYGFMLYALYVEYQRVDVFLDRSYWGIGQRIEGKFGSVTREQLVQIRSDRHSPIEIRLRNIAHLAELGMRAETEAFNALPAGLHISFEWHKNWFSDEVVALTVACGQWPEKRNIDVKITLLNAPGDPGTVVLDESGDVLDGTKKNDDGLLEWSKEWVFRDDYEDRYSMARVSYVIYGSSKHDRLAADEMLVKR